MSNKALERSQTSERSKKVSESVPLPVQLLHGAHATPLDYALVHLGGLGVGVGLLAVGALQSWELTLLQSVVLVALAWDTVGGIVSNSTRSTNEWHARRSRWFRVVFLLAHVAHALVATLAFDAGWNYFLLVWLTATSVGVAALALTGAPQRTVALGLVTVGATIQLTWLVPPAPLAWFGVAYLLKVGFSLPVDHNDIRARQESTGNESIVGGRP